MRFVRLTICAFVLSACGRGSSTAASPGSGDGDAAASVVVLADGAVTVVAAAAPESDPSGDALWTRAIAADADADDLARLALHEGAGGLEAKLDDAKLRAAAIAALAFVPEEERFDALPRLADIASAADANDAKAALATIEALAARAHRSVDREDALELRQGCDKLVAYAPNAPAERAPAVARSLSMLRDYGCGPISR